MSAVTNLEELKIGLNAGSVEQDTCSTGSELMCQDADAQGGVNYFIYAKDFSGSTCGVPYYHNNGLKTLEQFKREVQTISDELVKAGEPTESKIIYLHWGHECYEVNEEITVNTYVSRSGNMGTEPISIVEWIQRNYDICSDKNKIQLLYIITDGMIGHMDAAACSLMNENMHYERVVFHAFNKNLSAIDLSVVASFLKSRCVTYRNYELYDNIDISKEFDYDTIKINNFEAERENLKSYIKLKYINKFKHDANALQEIDKLKKLRNRLFFELGSQSEKTEDNLETRDRNEFLRAFMNTDWYKNLNAPAYDVKIEIEKSIQTLINYIVSETKSHSFDALKFETKYDKPVEEEPIAQINFPDEQEIEFPDIIMEDDKGIPVILLMKFSLLDKIILHRTIDEADAVSPASFNKFNAAMDCPLFLLNDPDISESIGYFYTLNVYKQFLENNIKTEPRTRRRFHGGLVLTDTDELDKYNDYILSATYFDSKKIHYNIGLFYFVLWKNCENKEWMDKKVVERFKKYIMRRISATVCKIGLSSLPLDPPIKISLPTALWYCVEMSSCIFKDDPNNFVHERLRMHYGVARCMIEILQHFSYDLDLESIEKRRDLISHVMVLKQIPTYKEKVYYLLKNIFKDVNGFLVSEIEHQSNLNKLNYLKLNHKGMLRDDIVEEKVHLNDYVHLMHYIDDLKNTEVEIKICDKTFRPFFAVGQNKSFYTELVKVTKKVIISNDDDKDKIEITFEALKSLEFDKILSRYNLFIKCVQNFKKYPTLPEYIEYISSKKKFYGDLVTIFPSNCYIGAEDTYSHYQNFLTNIDASTFIEVSKEHVNRVKRIKAETIVKFSNDEDINEFISGEEAKVNLKKNVCKRKRKN